MDESESSEYVPTSTSSDSEDCSSNEEGPDFPKETDFKVNKINTNFTQKVDELEGDSGDLEHEGDDEKEEGMSKIALQRCQKGEKRKWDKNKLLYLLQQATE